MAMYTQARWKLLLGVYKIKRLVHAWFGVRQLDYAPKHINILTDTLREYETRARSVAKEPGTVSWIEKYAGEGAVLYDVGANIGAYSLIAAAVGAKVIAFEPGHQNVFKLHENMLLNKLTKKIVVVPLALSSKGGVIRSVVPDRGFGASHSFSLAEQPADAALSDSFLAIGLDACIDTFLLPKPTMIKIDVDGAELEVLQGAVHTLKSPSLKTLLVEVETSAAEVRRLLEEEGFTLISEERSGTYTVNYVFERP